MSGDELSRAVRALRDEGEKPAPQARMTRDRILRELRPVRRDRRWVWAIPIAALLAGSTVLAATGHLPEVLTAAARVLGLSLAPPSNEEESSRAERAVHAPSRSQDPPAPVVVPPAPAPVVEAPASDESVAPAQPEQARADAGRALRHDAAKPPRATTPSPAQPSTDDAPPAASPPSGAAASGSSGAPTVTAPSGPDTLALYRRAHQLHFVAQQPAAALAAWDAYLASDPKGPLAVDARYDRALCLVRLGRKAEARRALEPFAAGTYGDYRRGEARALIEALDR